MMPTEAELSHLLSIFDCCLQWHYTQRKTMRTEGSKLKLDTSVPTEKLLLEATTWTRLT